MAIRRGATTVACGVDADGNWISVETVGRPAEIVRLPRWSGGVGGMELVASADERYVALFIYSGQSSQGYELFAIEPTLTHIGGLAEVRGTGTAPVFSPSCRWLVTFIGCERRVRGNGEYFESVQDEYADDRLIVDWARLYVQALPESAIHSVEVGVEIPRSTDIDVVREWNTYDAVRFVGDEIVLRMPWGEEISVASLPTGPVTSHGFGRP